MKRYHEMAHCRNGTEVKGFCLLDTTNGETGFYTKEAMLDLCKNEQVQFFGWDAAANTYKISYTDEEMKGQKAVSKKLTTITTLESYFDNDVQISYEYFELCRKNHEIVLCAIIFSQKMMLLGSMTRILVLGRKRALTSFTAALPKDLQKMCMNRNGIFSLSLSNVLLENRRIDEFPTNVIFDTQPIVSMDKADVIKAIKSNRKRSNVGKIPEASMPVIEFLESVNKRNLKRLLNNEATGQLVTKMGMF